MSKVLKNRFRGGVWIGFLASTWPYGILEINKDSIVLKDESLKKEFCFTHNEIDKIKVLKFFPIVGYGIRIIPVDKSKETRLFFWYTCFGFKNITDALKEYGWIS